MTPSEILAVKAAVRARDGKRCVHCGMTDEKHIARYGRTLDVHRVVPGSEYSLAPGVCKTLCRPCHALMPKRPRGTRPPEEKVVVRIAADVVYMARIVAAFDGVSLSECVNRLLAPAVAADLEERRHSPP